MLTRARRTALSVLALAGLFMVPPNAVQAEYVGAGAIFNPVGCDWPTQVEMTTARYVPHNFDGGQTSEIILNFAVGGINSYRVQGDLTPARDWRPANGESIWGRVYSMQPRPRLRIQDREGINWSGDWPEARDIQLRFDVRNFNGHRGCSVTVALNLTRLQ